MTTEFEFALDYATAAHHGQVDKNGVDYIRHPIAVAESLDKREEEYLRVAALLHDVVEDTDVTLEDLTYLGIDARAVAIVDVLTRRDGETYFDYVKRIVNSKNGAAIQVKIADVAHNMSRPYPGDEGMKKRYAKTLAILNDYFKL